MARYLVSVRTDLAPDDAFDYLADLRNFAAWDPGVARVEQIDGDGAGPDSSFDVSVRAGLTSITLRYRTIEFDPPHSAVVVAENALLVSTDTIIVRAADDGSIVTYDAVLELKGVLGLGDPLLAMTFKGIGDKAAAGLIEALHGQRVDQPA